MGSDVVTGLPDGCNDVLVRTAIPSSVHHPLGVDDTIQIRERRMQDDLLGIAIGLAVILGGYVIVLMSVWHLSS